VSAGWALLVALALGALSCAGASAPATPQGAAPTMTRLVFRDRSPDVDAASPAGDAFTLYRVGSCCGRMEYPPGHPTDGQHVVVIVNEPHAFWMDQRSRTGIYSRDPGPQFVFRAPMLRTESSDSEPLPSLEFGREYAFLAAHGGVLVAPQPGDGEGAERWEASVGDWRVVLVAEAGTHRPREVRIHRGGKLFKAFVYDEYQAGLAPDAALFWPPEDVRFRGRQQ
jgi:hypothetical protein